MTTFVYNGWAAENAVWDACAFPRDRIYSYLDQLTDAPARDFAAADEAVLVGFSMGGIMALEHFLSAPAKVRGLVLVSATPRMSADPATDWPGMGEHRLGAFLQGAVMMNRGNPSPLFDAANLKRGLDRLRGRDLRAPLRACAARGETGLPVAVVHSADDYIVRAHNPAFFREVFPAAHVEIVPGAEHTLPAAAAARVDAAVRDVFERIGT